MLLHFCLFFIPFAAWSQTPPPQSRVVERVNESALVTLRGNTHPLAQLQYDQGAAPPDLPMARMLLVLKRGDAQESALQTLLDGQQDRNSPSYHQWLTPDTFGQQFGPSDQDIQAIAAWLRSHGFQIGAIGRGRTVIEFSGTAGQVQQAFHTEIHRYIVNGEEHWANANSSSARARGRRRKFYAQFSEEAHVPASGRLPPKRGEGEWPRLHHESAYVRRRRQLLLCGPL
jgi:hypothetical protein